MSPQPSLDARLRSRGERVEEIRLRNGWLVIRRADGPKGVVLQVRIPGLEHEDRPCKDQPAAILAASAVWDEYCQAVKDLAS